VSRAASARGGRLDGHDTCRAGAMADRQPALGHGIHVATSPDQHDVMSRVGPPRAVQRAEGSGPEHGNSHGHTGIDIASSIRHNNFDAF
jgi:hypothetical protein